MFSNPYSYGNNYIQLCNVGKGRQVILILQTVVRKYVFFERCIVNNIGTNMKNKSMNVIRAKVEASASRSRLTYDFGFGDETKGFAMQVRGGRLVENTARRKIFYHVYS